ncbi:DeoR/GlpR family DNA-binding transcription regulator [Oceanobacillus sojae]|uniref:DeoR/GlpR family DNA-binding transcription regulator n=1 Tax=Oceanobacillus sojae TaxID=582851 RepID=UPI0021A5F1BC|nr:DeoR/GlpR family DNA-binding transcription regulator [Oceanobacillus sojae]MCT1901587.1 DeoR/GlpR family DNA-binding transcription regulator [Oceanobacillus sojae]
MMLKEERKQRILDILSVEQKVIASDLSQLFNVSEDTVRRDLKELDNQGLLKRVHRGALRIGPPVTDFTYRQTVEKDAKSAIADKALPFLKEESVIIIDGSTTNLTLVEMIPQDFRATIITNSPPIAVALSQHRNIEVINLGGIFYKRSMINVGVETYQSLSKMRADLYIMGIYNIDIESGVSVPTLQEAEIKSRMIDVSTEVLSMLTRDKFGTVSKHIVSSIEDISYLISDDITEQIRRDYSKEKVLLID